MERPARHELATCDTRLASVRVQDPMAVVRGTDRRWNESAAAQREPARDVVLTNSDLEESAVAGKETQGAQILVCITTSQSAIQLYG